MGFILLQKVSAYKIYISKSLKFIIYHVKTIRDNRNSFKFFEKEKYLKKLITT